MKDSTEYFGESTIELIKKEQLKYYSEQIAYIKWCKAEYKAEYPHGLGELPLKQQKRKWSVIIKDAQEYFTRRS